MARRNGTNPAIPQPQRCGRSTPVEVPRVHAEGTPRDGGSQRAPIVREIKEAAREAIREERQAQSGGKAGWPKVAWLILALAGIVYAAGQMSATFATKTELREVETGATQDVREVSDRVIEIGRDVRWIRRDLEGRD